MVLICPHCAARSLVDHAHAAKPSATVACGGCHKKYFARAAHRDTSRQAPEAVQDTKQLSSVQPRRSVRRWLRPVSALVAPLALLGLLVWDLRGVGPLDTDIRAELQLPPPATGPAQGCTLEDVMARPYAPAGGPEGLLIMGKLSYQGAVPGTVEPVVLIHLRHPSLAGVQSARLQACANCTLEQKESLSGLATSDTPQPITLPPKTMLPFIGLMELPTLARGASAPWQVEVVPPPLTQL